MSSVRGGGLEPLLEVALGSWRRRGRGVGRGHGICRIGRMMSWRIACDTGVFAAWLFLWGSALAAPGADSTSANVAHGRVAGEVRDRATQQPLAYATVEFPVLERGAVVSRVGRFEIQDLPPGIYTLRARHVGYAPLEVPDILVRVGKTTQLVVEMDRRDLRAQRIVVRADPYAGRGAAPVSTQELSYEEVRRAPGSAADIARTVQALPGVAHASDQSSDLIVRGGAPTENLTLLDDVPIPNANHFPEYGGAGGAISMLNVELVRGVSFHTGGFPVQHGDKLSSVLEVHMRDGNRDEFSGDLDISMAGAGLVVEGPFAAGRGSYLLNGRRSYIDLVARQLNTTTTPQYSDVQGKLVLRPDARNTLSLVGVAGFDRVTLDDEEDAYSRGFDYVDAHQTQYAAGVSWKRLLGDRGHAILTLHRSENSYDYDIRDRLRPGGALDPAYVSDAWEAETGLRARSVLRLLPNTDVTLGGELRRAQFRHFITAFADTAQEALPTARADSVRLVVLPRHDVRTRDGGTKGALFASWEQRLGTRVTSTFGLRWDRFDFGGQEAWSPRAGVTYRPAEGWTARASAGLFRQTPFAVQLTQTPATWRLPYSRAEHYVFGIDRRLTRSAQVTLEAFVKRYRDLPVQRERGSYEIVSDGTGQVRGLELFVQQRLLERWYGLASYSYSRSERTDRVHGTFADEWDYRQVLTLLGGFRPRSGLEVSARWRYIGGRPFTTFTQRFEVTPEGRMRSGTGYWVGFEGPFNGGRLPGYHRLDLRVDQRRQLGRFHLVAFLDIENVYVRDNVLLQRYSHARAAPEPVFQWKLLPVGGLSLEF